MTPAPHPVLRRIDAHHVILETDGWLCFKYLDCGEESMSPFADVSKGDIIEWGLPGRTSASSDKVLDLFHDIDEFYKLHDDGTGIDDIRVYRSALKNKIEKWRILLRRELRQAKTTGEDDGGA